MNTAQPMRSAQAGVFEANPQGQGLQPLECTADARQVGRFAKIEFHLAHAGYSLTRALGGYHVITPSNRPIQPGTLGQAPGLHRRVS
jgi:hypothetical protein